MNVVHRCRFTDWQPSAIISLAIAPSGTKFAALRVNGNIEVWSQVIQDNPDSVLAVNDNGTKYELSTFLSKYQPLSPTEPDSTGFTSSNPTESTNFFKNSKKNNPLQEQQQAQQVRLASTQEHLYRYASIYYLSAQWVCTTMIPGTGKNVFSQILWSFVDPVANPHMIPDFKIPISTTTTTNSLISTSISSPNTTNTHGNTITLAFPPKSYQIIDRLFTLGSNGRIVEWDLFNSLPKFSTQSHGRALLCGTVSPSGTQLAVGCQDGTIRIFKIAHADQEPILISTLTRHKKGQVITVDWLHFSHIKPPNTPILQNQPGSHRHDTVKSTAHQHIKDSSWWDPPLLCSGGTDGYLKIWNVSTKMCTLEIKADSIRFDVKRQSSERGKLVEKLKSSGNKRFLKEIGIKNVAIKTKKLIGNENNLELKKNLKNLQIKLQKSIKKDKEKNINLKKKIFSSSNDKNKNLKNNKKILNNLRSKNDMFSSSSDDEDEDDDSDDMSDGSDDSDGMGLSDDEMSENQEASENEDDIGLMPKSSSKTISSKKKSKNELNLSKINLKNLKKISRFGGRVKANNHILKVKWLDVETIACLDQTSHLLIVNAKTGVITTKHSLQQSLLSPTDLAVIPATLHTRSIAHPFNITYFQRYFYQIHPSLINLGRENQLLTSIFTPPSQNIDQNGQITQSSGPEYIPAFKTNQIFIPNPILYVSGVNGRVVELTSTKSLDLGAAGTALSANDGQNGQNNGQNFDSPFAHTKKFMSTGLHGIHTHDIACLTLAPTLVQTYRSNDSHYMLKNEKNLKNLKNSFSSSFSQQQPTSQLTLFSAGIDTIISTYSIHPFNINDINLVKTYFQYLKPLKLQLLSTPPEIALSNYTSPWSHHWTIGKHQKELNQNELNEIYQNFNSPLTNKIHSNFLQNQKILKRSLIETIYHIKTIPGINTLPKFTICLCPQCQISNIPSILNTNLTIRLLYSLHLLPSTHQSTYGIKVSNVGNGCIKPYYGDNTHQYSTSMSENDEKNENSEEEKGEKIFLPKSFFYEPYFLYNKQNIINKKSQESLLNYIPLNSLELSWESDKDSTKLVPNQLNTARIYSPTLINLLKKSPTLQFVQQSAPVNPIFAYPRGFSIDIYTLTNHDQLLVRDKLLLDKETQLKCSSVGLNNVLCDMQLYQGTVVLDRNAFIATLLGMYTGRQSEHLGYLKDQNKLQQAIIQQNNNQNGQNNGENGQNIGENGQNSQNINENGQNINEIGSNVHNLPLSPLGIEYNHHESNPHLFRDNVKLGKWHFHEPAFGLNQHPTATYQSTTHTIDSSDPERRIDSVTPEEPLRLLQNGRFTKIPSQATLPNYILSLRIALANVSATTSTQLSPNGRLLLTSDATTIKLWGLKWGSDLKNCNQNNEKNKKNNQKNLKITTSIEEKYAISPVKIEFPPQVPTLSQYLRSVFTLQDNEPSNSTGFGGKNNQNDGNNGKNGQNDGNFKKKSTNFDLNLIPDHLYEQCVEEHHYITLFTQLLSENGCQCASFSPCSSMLAVSLTPYAGANPPPNYSNLNVFDLPSEEELISDQYPYLGTVILIDLVTYSIIGYIKRNKIHFFSKILGITLPPKSNTVGYNKHGGATKGSLIGLLREHYKEEHYFYSKNLNFYKNNEISTVLKENNGQNGQNDGFSQKNDLIRYSTTAVLPLGYNSTNVDSIDHKNAQISNKIMKNDEKNQKNQKILPKNSKKLINSSDSSSSSSSSDNTDSDSSSTSSSDDSDSDSDEEDQYHTGTATYSRYQNNQNNNQNRFKNFSNQKNNNFFEEEKISKYDLISTIQFSPCGRYLSTLDENNSIRLYQLFDKCFTPSMVHIHTISATDDSNQKNQQNLVKTTTTNTYHTTSGVEHQDGILLDSLLQNSKNSNDFSGKNNQKDEKISKKNQKNTISQQKTGENQNVENNNNDDNDDNFYSEQQQGYQSSASSSSSQRISSYQLLPTIADLKQSHLTPSLTTKHHGIDSDHLIQSTNTRKVLNKMVGPSRLDRVLKMLFKWALNFITKKNKDDGSNKKNKKNKFLIPSIISPVTIATTGNTTGIRASSLFKRNAVTASTVATNTPANNAKPTTASSAATKASAEKNLKNSATATTSENQSSFIKQHHSSSTSDNNLVIKNDDDIDSDSDDYNEYDGQNNGQNGQNKYILSQFDSQTIVQLGIDNIITQKSNTMGDNTQGNVINGQNNQNNGQNSQNSQNNELFGDSKLGKVKENFFYDHQNQKNNNNNGQNISSFSSSSLQKRNGKYMKSFFENQRKNIRVDLDGFNPHHLLSELLHLLLLSSFNSPISRLFLSLRGINSQNSSNNGQNGSNLTNPTLIGHNFNKLIKEKITNFENLPQSTLIGSSFLFNFVEFDYEIFPSICGSYSNGHYFVYDTNSKSYLGYDSSRPNEILNKNEPNNGQNNNQNGQNWSKNHQNQFQNGHNNGSNSTRLRSDLADSGSRGLLLVAATGGTGTKGQSSQNSQNNGPNGQKNSIFQQQFSPSQSPPQLWDPLSPPRRTNYHSQVMPFRETALLNEFNPNIPSLLHSDISPIMSTSHHVNYRPLVSFDDSYMLKNSSLLGGLLASFSIIFATNQDSYSLSLPLHRVYPSVFKHIISSAYYQVIDVIKILDKLNQGLVNESLANSTPTTTSTTSTATSTSKNDQNTSQNKDESIIPSNKPKKRSTPTQLIGQNGQNGQNNGQNGQNGQNILLKIAQLGNINHEQRVNLLMTELLSLLPIQRLKSIGRYRPVLAFKFLHPQPTIEIGSMKSLFFFVNNVISTHWNFDILPSVPIRPQIINNSGKSNNNDKNDKKMKNDDDTTDDDDDSDDNDSDDDNEYDVGKVKITPTNSNTSKSKKRSKQNGQNNGQNEKIVNNYNAPHYVGFASEEISNVTLNIPSIVVESPWIQVINSLPPAAYKKKWGKL